MKKDNLNDVISGLKWGKIQPIEAHDRIERLFQERIIDYNNFLNIITNSYKVINKEEDYKIIFQSIIFEANKIIKLTNDNRDSRP